MGRLIGSFGFSCIVFALGGCMDLSYPARIHYANPGGMWMPRQMTQHRSTLRSLGVKNPDALADLQGYPLGAIVWLGGCSASFVSPHGLIATNHHCAVSSLQFHSTPENNLFENGFLARTRQEELPGETGKKVWITQEIIDVSPEIRSGLEDIADPVQRYTEIQQRIKDRIAREEDPDKGIRCEIKAYYEGQYYYLLKYVELRDIRLVYAPPESIGAYGGDIDNWQWPRHTGDFTFYRAYVSPSGQPAEYSPDNVPYQPRHWLRIADEPLEPDDFVLVAGYPGRTQRWKTLDEVLYLYQTDNPMRIRILGELADLYTALGEQNDELWIKVKPRYQGVMNSLKLLTLIQENITQSNLIDEKIRQQTDLEDWIAADRNRQKKWGQAISEIARINEQVRRTARQDYLLDGTIHSVNLLSAAHTIVRMAEQRPTPDDQREPDLQQRNHDRLIQSLQRMQTSYDPAIDKALLSYYLQKINELPPAQRDPLQAAIAESGLQRSQEIEAFVQSLFSDALVLDDADQRVTLFQQATLEELRQHNDPFIQLALRLRPFTQEQERDRKRYAGMMALLRPAYVQARQAFYGKPLAPDANGTLRLTFGTVKGYRPTPQSPVYYPFTTLSQVLEKHTGQRPFDAPEKLRTAAAQVYPKMEFYADNIDDIPVNFLSDTDITGGNSGSATLNHKGQWVGLVFDGNAEAAASDLMFMPDITRAIHVDLRYILWIMKYVDHADELLAELGL